MGETEFNTVTYQSLAGRGHLFNKSAKLQYVITFHTTLITSAEFITAMKTILCAIKGEQRRRRRGDRETERGGGGEGKAVRGETEGIKEGKWRKQHCEHVQKGL